jgi:hypothetical protein
VPFFKTTHNILVDGGEHFDPNWMDSDSLVLPPKTNWDYSRELQIEDIDIWEVVYQQGGGLGIYAAWSPYAEFYLVRVGWKLESKGHGLETYYGPGASDKVYKRAKELGIDLVKNKHWVEPEDMWLYQ